MVAIGQPAPDFSLPNQDGQMISLSDYRGKKVIIFAFPKAGTAGCTAQACAFRDTLPKIEAENTVVLGLSTDAPEALKQWQDRERLPYDLLSDPDKQAITALGAGDNSLLGFINLPGAKRSYWVIDEQGKIIDMQVGVSPRASVEKALKAVQGVQQT
ncbi:MAG: peroxiredoxin [Anaerolineaceae bacterium]|nr:peroxiredoxin [Anaerolineaceae bacterium]